MLRSGSGAPLRPEALPPAVAGCVFVVVLDEDGEGGRRLGELAEAVLGVAAGWSEDDCEQVLSFELPLPSYGEVVGRDGRRKSPRPLGCYGDSEVAVMRLAEAAARRFVERREAVLREERILGLSLWDEEAGEWRDDASDASEVACDG